MSVRSAALWSMGAQYLVFAINFSVSVVISRLFLAPAEVGLFSLALSAAMLVSILQDFGITRYIAGQSTLDEQAIRACFSVSLTFATLIALGILALSIPAAHFYREPKLAPMLAIIALSFLMVPFSIVPAALIQRELRFKDLFWVNLGQALANASVALTLAALGWSAFSLAWAAVAAQATRGLIARAKAGHKLPIRWSYKGAKPILRFGSGMSALYIIGSMSVRSPELIIGRAISVTAVGLYGRASSLSDQLQSLVSGAIGSVFYPAFARMRDAGEPLDRPYMRVIAGYTATTWPAMAFLAAAATPIVSMLYGPKWIGVAEPLRYVALTQIGLTALPLQMEIPLILGQMRRLMKRSIIDTSLSITTLLIGATVSLQWAAMSRVVYVSIWVFLYGGFLRELTGFRWPPMLWLYCRSGLSALATIAPLLLLFRSIPPLQMGPLPLLGAAGAGVLCWLVTIFVVRHPMADEIRGIAGPALARLRAA